MGGTQDPAPIVRRGHGPKGIADLLNPAEDREVGDLRPQIGHIGLQALTADPIRG